LIFPMSLSLAKCQKSLELFCNVKFAFFSNLLFSQLTEFNSVIQRLFFKKCRKDSCLSKK
jgi:hypothetical protein